MAQACTDGDKKDDKAVGRNELETTSAPTTPARAYDESTGQSLSPLALRLKRALPVFWASLHTFRGLIVTIYALNVVAWGGMLFLLLCNAAPAMCHPDCNNINSSRRIWIDINSRVLTTLMATPAFLLAPERLRNLHYLVIYHMWKDAEYLSLLIAANDAWFQTEPSAAIESKFAYRQIALWKLGCVVWARFTNTVAYVVAMASMWCYNRFNRPRSGVSGRRSGRKGAL
ncbi:hypothetical protein LTS15_011279 [Exophiala xenobiotica]|nr:hypothetical protein LTS15_011279 [Exophiala xenobiotica]